MLINQLTFGSVCPESISVQPRPGIKRSLPRDLWGRIDRSFSQAGSQEGSRYVALELSVLLQKVELKCLVVFGPGLGVHAWGDEIGVVIAIRTFNGHDLFSCVAGDAGATGEWITFFYMIFSYSSAVALPRLTALRFWLPFTCMHSLVRFLSCARSRGRYLLAGYLPRPRPRHQSTLSTSSNIINPTTRP